MSREKKIISVIVIIAIACATVCLSYKRWTGPSKKKAAQAAVAYAEAVDYQYEHAGVIYQWMTDEYKASMSKEDFIAAFEKERSYPYLTPLFITYDRIEMADDLKSGTAYYSQSARLPGMVYEVGLIFEDGQYHIQDFASFLDGSYLEKFDTVTYDLSSYFDTEAEDVND